MTNKTESAKSIILFHNGRGSQEAISGDAKTDAAFDIIPTKRLVGNQIFTLCSMMAHNLSRELQMLASPAFPRALPKVLRLGHLKDLIVSDIALFKGRVDSPNPKEN